MALILIARDRPGRAGLNTFHAWIKRDGWRISAVVALAAGVCSLVKGISALT